MQFCERRNRLVGCHLGQQVEAAGEELVRTAER